MKKLLILLTTLMFLLVSNPASADEKSEKSKKDSSNIGMRIKLDLSKQILAALSEGDFESLEESAKAMRALNQIEWFVSRKTPGYQTQLKTFQFSTDELVRNANEKNIDGATLGFTQMTISCVNCHKAIRRN